MGIDHVQCLLHVIVLYIINEEHSSIKQNNHDYFDLYKSQLTLQVELKEFPPVNDVQHLFILRDFLQYNILMGNEFTKYPL